MLKCLVAVLSLSVCLVVLLFTAGRDFALPQASAGTDEVAVCGPVKGMSYYHNYGITSEKDRGWQEDGISKQKVILNNLGNGDLDLLFVDAYGLPQSAIQDGFKVIALRWSSTEIAVASISPSIIEIFNFYKEEDGSLKYDHLQNKKGGLISKSSLFIGQCYSINF